MSNYLDIAILNKGKPYQFMESARLLHWRYVLLHFFMIFTLLYIPVFYHVVTTPPYALFQRVFPLRFDEAGVFFYPNEPFNPARLLDNEIAIKVFSDTVVFQSTSINFYAPIDFFPGINEMHGFEVIFNMLAMYNHYIAHLLIPMILLTIFIVLTLKIFFYIVTAYFLGAFRMKSSIPFTFNERIKISIMSSLPVALLCAVLAVVIPIVHIILFQAVNLFILFLFSKKYDLREKEILGVM